MKVKQNFAEPRYHNRIGKVENRIGFIQSILRTYIGFDKPNNLISNDKLNLQDLLILHSM